MSTCEFCFAKKKWEDEECCKFCEICQTYKSSALPDWVYDHDIGADVCGACDALHTCSLCDAPAVTLTGGAENNVPLCEVCDEHIADRLRKRMSPKTKEEAARETGALLPCETCGTECHQCCGLEDEDGHAVWNCRECCCGKEEE